MAFYDFFTEGQANARARILAAAMQPLKNNEDAVREFRIEADAVVAHRKGPLARLTLGGNVHPRRRLAPELDRIANQILEQLSLLGGVRRHRGQLFVGHQRPALLDRSLQVRDSRSQDL